MSDCGSAHKAPPSQPSPARGGRGRARLRFRCPRERNAQPGSLPFACRKNQRTPDSAPSSACGGRGRARLRFRCPRERNAQPGSLPFACRKKPTNSGFSPLLRLRGRAGVGAKGPVMLPRCSYRAPIPTFPRTRGKGQSEPPFPLPTRTDRKAGFLASSHAGKPTTPDSAPLLRLWGRAGVGQTAP